MTGHGTSLYLQQIHVPLLIVFPGKVPADQRISAPVGLQAITGTVAELAGLTSTPRGRFAYGLLVRCGLWNRERDFGISR